MQVQSTSKKVIGGLIVVLFLAAGCGTVASSDDPVRASAASSAQQADAERGYELSMEASGLLSEAQAEAVEASQGTSVAEVCSHLPSLQAKVGRVDEIVAELHTLNLSSEATDALQVVDDSMVPVHEVMPVLEGTC